MAAVGNRERRQAASVEWRRSRIVLGRMAVLPTECLDLQISPELDAYYRELSRLELAMEALAPELADALFAIIPQLDRADRRAALELKRQIFAKVAADESLVGRALPMLARHRAMLEEWSGLAEAREAMLAAAERDFAALDEAAVERMIVAALGVREFDEALALTSPGVHARIGDLTKGGKKARHSRHKLQRFVHRAAYKTAPLNGLANVSLFIDGEPQSIDAAHEDRIDQAVIFGKAIDSLGEETRYLLNRSLRWRGVVCTYYGFQAQRLHGLRRYGNRHMRLPPDLAEALRAVEEGAAISGGALVRMLADAGLAGEEADLCLRRMILSGLLIPALPDGLYSTNGDLLAQLRATPHFPVAEIEQKQANGQRSYRTSWASAPQHVLTEEALAELDAFVAHLPSRVGVTPAYSHLLRDFIYHHGRGGHCPDVLDWLRHVHHEGLARPSESEVIERITAPWAATMYFVVYEPKDSLAPIIECNTVHSRSGWQLGRFGFGDSIAPQRIRQVLQEDIAQHVAPARPITLPIDADVINVQSNPTLFEDIVRLPSHPGLRGTAVPIEAISARHDEDTNRLVLRHRGEEVHPIYNGGALLNKFHGVAQMLAAIADPFYMPAFSRPVDHSNREGVIRLDDEVIGRTLVAKAHLRVPSHLLRPVFARAGFARYRAAREFCEEMGIPPRNFVWAYNTGGVAIVARPHEYSTFAWVDVRVDDCLEFLSSLLQYDWIAFDRTAHDQCVEGTGVAEGGHVRSFCTEAYYASVSATDVSRR